MSGTLLAHKALLAGLATLIPVPFVDGAVKQAVQRSLVRALAERHGVSLSPRSVSILADDESTPLLRGLASKVMLMPLRWALRRAVIVLSVKGVVDAVSDVYHRGVLLDHAFAEKHCAPQGPHSSAEIRRAIDAVCKETVTSPVEHAIRAGLEPYKSALGHAADVLRGRLAAEERPDDEGSAERATASAEVASERGLLSVVMSLAGEIGKVPGEYFDDVRFKLDARLAGEAKGVAVKAIG